MHTFLIVLHGVRAFGGLRIKNIAQPDGFGQLIFGNCLEVVR